MIDEKIQKVVQTIKDINSNQNKINTNENQENAQEVLKRIEEVNTKCNEIKILINSEIKIQKPSETKQENTKYEYRQDVKGDTNPQDDQENFDFWIVGTSIVKNVYGNKMYKNKKVRVTKLWEKTVEGAIKFIRTGKVKTKNLLFQVGSNDLEDKSPENVLNEIEELCAIAKTSMPNTNIVVAEILPRCYEDNRHDSEVFNEKCHLFNKLLEDFSNDTDFKVVKLDKIDTSHMYDGIHLNNHGVRLYVTCVKEVMNPLLGVYYEKGQSSNGYDYFKFSRENPKSSHMDRRYNASNHNYITRDRYQKQNDNVYNQRSRPEWRSTHSRTRGGENDLRDFDEMYRMLDRMRSGMKDREYYFQ